MTALIWAIGVLTFAGLVLLGVLRVLDSQLESKRLAIAARVKSAAAERKASCTDLDLELSSKLVDVDVDMRSAIEEWQAARSAVLDRSGERPWNYSDDAFNDWARTQLSTELQSEIAENQRWKAILVTVLLVAAMIVAVSVYVSLCRSYLDTI